MADLSVLPQPPYIPDLTASDLHIFGPLKEFLQGHILRTTRSLKAQCTGTLGIRILIFVAGKQDIERMWRNLAKMSDTAWRRNSFKCRVGLQFSVYFICISVRIKWIQSRRYDFVTAHLTCQTCEFSGSVQVLVKLNWVDCVLILIQCERTFVYVMYMVQAAYVYKLIDTRWVMWWITCKPSLLHRSFSLYRIQAASI